MQLSTTIYQDNGYQDRSDYLMGLADEYGLDEVTVLEVADLLGEDEDFDGLLNTLQDAENFL